VLGTLGQGRWKLELDKGMGCGNKINQPATLNEEKETDEGGLPD
jgi:hypothetical protein